MAKHEITIERLQSLFRIDVRSGRLFWKKGPRTHPRLRGAEAGSPRQSHSGKIYWIVKIDGIAHRRSHLIFLVVHGRYPHPLIDHKDGNSLDDRPENLRDATILENAWNHKRRKRRIELPMGVRLTAAGNYQARIGYRGRQIHLGAYDNEAEAHQVYLAKRQQLYGEFA